MSLPRYSEYRPSGVSWLGEVPKHWNVTPLKHAVTMSSGGTPSKENPAYWDGDVPWASAKDLKVENLTDTEDHVTRLAVDSGVVSLVAADSILVVTRGMILAHTFPVVRTLVPLAINQDLKAVRPLSGIVPDFLAWLLRGTATESLARCDEAAHGTRVLRMNDWTSMHVPVPPLNEQAAIASFLDRETAKIDVLVAEQHRLIKSLDEERRTLVSHAVTKGKNPTVPMTEATLGWPGEVPAHWTMSRLKDHAEFVTSGSRGWAANYSDDGAQFIRIANLTRDSIELDLSDVQRVFVPDSAEATRTRVGAGDLLFSITAYLGSVAVAPEGIEESYVNQHVALVRLRGGRLLSRWVGYVALSTIGRTWFEVRSYGGTKIQLSLDDVREMPVPTPPLAEQSEIVGAIDATLKRRVAMIAEAERAIELLRERRACLIAAAVTGGIDVRGVVGNEAA